MFLRSFLFVVATICCYNKDMRCDWDEDKNKTNIKKHKIDFRDAHRVLSNEHLVLEDNRKDYNEKRYVAMGWLKGRMVVVVYTIRQNIYRIISMRKANEREKQRFKNRF